jgi:hypothetical protein
MGDALVGVQENRDMGIYGFSYKKTDPRPDPENVSLLIKFGDKGSLKNFQDNFIILKNIEEGLGFATTYPEVVNYPGKNPVVWVLGDNRWQGNAVAFSLYSYLLKTLTYPIKNKDKWMEEIKANKTNEGLYMDIPYFKFLFSGGLNDIEPFFKNFSGYPKGVEIHTLHHSSGFVAAQPQLVGTGTGGVESHGGIEKNHVLYGFFQKKKAA